MSAPRVWSRTAGVSAWSAGSVGLFETSKVIDGEVFALGRHMRRLGASLAALGLEPADDAVLEEGLAAVLDEPLPRGRVRWTVTASADALRSHRGAGGYTYTVTASEPSPGPSSVGVVLAPWTRNERGASVGLKSTAYAENVVAMAYAKRQGAGEAIIANTRGELCEGTSSNVFVVVDDEIVTPPLESGALPGVTRELVLQWCRADGIPVSEQVLPVSVLDSADEVFLTSATRDVMAVDRVGERSLSPGPLTAAAAQSFARHSAKSRNP
ncbi:MAG: aminotransferase class IV [Actinomycetia bacterium]|nr:aminotransferase class IV [Actinomycetes bacterium]